MTEQTHILELERENLRLRQENRQLRTLLRRNRMELALGDDRLSQEITRDMAQFYEAPLAPWYIFVLFFWNQPGQNPLPIRESLLPLDKIVKTYGGLLSQFGQYFFFEVAGAVACLMNVSLPCEPDENPDAGKAFCTRLRDSLLQTLEQDSSQSPQISHIAISHASRLEQGPRSLFRSAESVSERRHRDSPRVLMEEGRVHPSTQNLHQIFSLEPLFWRQIQQHAFFDAAGTLDSIIELTILDQGTLERASASLFSRMEMVLQAALSEKGADPMTMDEFPRLLPAISEAKTYQQLREVCYDILATLEDRFYTPLNGRNKKMPNIEAYIQKNYRDQMMCATSIADEFKISPSYLSRIFKSDMGMGIVEYIHRIRIDAAKTLLADPNLTIDAVAQMVGFSNRWVLTRVFKKTVGVTPGAYRDDSRISPQG